jgi:hypothetical protein
MLVYAPFALCFVTLRGIFMRFPDNLLMRCHSASSLFSDVFVFQKRYTGNILGIGRNKSRNSYFSRKKDEDLTGAGGRPEGSLTIGWRAPGPRGPMVRWPY